MYSFLKKLIGNKIIMIKKMDESWLGWVKENIDRGCDTFDLYERLTKKGFSQNSIQKAMGEYYPEGISEYLSNENEVDYNVLSKHYKSAINNCPKYN